MIDEIEDEWDDMSLAQRRKLEPVKDAIEYTEETLESEEEFFDPVHAMALREDVKSRPLDEIFEQFEKERENSRAGSNASKSLVNYLDDVVENARDYTTAMELEHVYREIEDEFADVITDVSGGLEEVQAIDDPLARRAQEDASEIDGRVTDHLPEEPTDFGYTLLEIFQEEYRLIREEYAPREPVEPEKPSEPSGTRKDEPEDKGSDIVTTNNGVDWSVLDYEPSVAEKSLYRSIAELDDVQIDDVRSAFYWSWVDMNGLEANSGLYPEREERSRLKDVKKGFDELLSEGSLKGKGAGKRSELDTLLKTARYVESEGYTHP